RAPAAIYQNGPFHELQVLEVARAVGVGGHRELRMPGAELREAEDLLRAAAVGGGERAHEALPVPPDSGADDLAEAERAADRRNVEVHARAQERQHVAAPPVLCERRAVRLPAAPAGPPGGELRGPRIQ